MKMHLLSGGRLRMRRSIYYPGAARDEQVELPVSCALLRHKSGNVLFDTGCHPSIAVDAEPRWGKLASIMVPIGGAQDNVVDQLRCTGLGPNDVDVVVCSHLHPDHCGCNTLFPRATVLCQRVEIEAARRDGAVAQGYLPVEFDRDMTALDGEHDVFGDGRIVLLPMPGHTPGMMCAAVALDRDGAFLLASDAVSVMASLDQDYAPRNTVDVPAQMRTLAEIRRLRDAGSTILCGHDDAQWTSLRKGAEFYE